MDKQSEFNVWLRILKADEPLNEITRIHLGYCDTIRKAESLRKQLSLYNADKRFLLEIKEQIKPTDNL